MYIAFAFILSTFITKTVVLGNGDLSANRNTSIFKQIPSCPECKASNAVDGDINTCTQTEFGKTSPYQNTWWYVDLGAVHSVYNIRIQFRDYGQMYTMRQRGRFAGFSLYVSNSTDMMPSGVLCYKDGPELPPLDFNINCTIYGRYVIFYNERLVGTNYPVEYVTANVISELCDVTVTDCSDLGVYGSNCDIPCPENCQERRCDVINGTCFGCTPGWVGEYCTTGCTPGYYGPKCESKCFGHCKDNEPCNHINGLCDNGCYDGWTGKNCTTECSTGRFGPDCVYDCSGHCMGDVTCNRTTGRCDTGCKAGYTGELCDTGCKHGTFGTGCRNQCSKNCLNNAPCNSIHGHCESGCASGYLDVFCNKRCKNGTYGLNCMQNCSLNCMDGLCDNVDGSCSCFGENQFPFCKDAYSQSNDSKDNCNESFYIAGVSIFVITTIVLGIVCLLFIRKYHRLLKKMRSLQYSSITRTSPQPDNTGKDQQYEELRISENSYHNIELQH